MDRFVFPNNESWQAWSTKRKQPRLPNEAHICEGHMLLFRKTDQSLRESLFVASFRRVIKRAAPAPVLLIYRSWNSGSGSSVIIDFIQFSRIHSCIWAGLKCFLV